MFSEQKLNVLRQLECAEAEEQPVYVNFRAGIGDQSSKQLTELFRMIHQLAIKDSHLIITSPGGTVVRGLELHNFLKALPINLTTHNLATIDSIANIVFLSAAKERRFASNNARFFFHGVRRGFGGQSATLGQLQEAVKAVERDQEAIADTIASRTKMTRREIELAFASETILSPQQAKQKGIIADIRELEIPTNAQLINIHDPQKDDED